MQMIPESHQDLLLDEKQALAVLATIMNDGSPQATPIWFDVADGLIRVNTARGRVKDHNMTTRPKVAITILDPVDKYRYLQIRGEVVQVTEEGAREHIDVLAKKYLGEETYPRYQGETRVMYLVQPRSVDAH